MLEVYFGLLKYSFTGIFYFWKLTFFEGGYRGQKKTGA
jgi:hypothetical protein